MKQLKRENNQPLPHVAAILMPASRAMARSWLFLVADAGGTDRREFKEPPDEDERSD
jgi:hexokinase